MIILRPASTTATPNRKVLSSRNSDFYCCYVSKSFFFLNTQFLIFFILTRILLLFLDTLQNSQVKIIPRVSYTVRKVSTQNPRSMYTLNVYIILYIIL